MASLIVIVMISVLGVAMVVAVGSATSWQMRSVTWEARYNQSVKNHTTALAELYTLRARVAQNENASNDARLAAVLSLEDVKDRVRVAIGDVPQTKLF